MPCSFHCYGQKYGPRFGHDFFAEVRKEPAVFSALAAPGESRGLDARLSFAARVPRLPNHPRRQAVNDADHGNDADNVE